jgi:hypothetical protein
MSRESNRMSVSLLCDDVSPLDVFEHPYAFAAFRHVELMPATSADALLAA